MKTSDSIKTDDDTALQWNGTFESSCIDENDHLYLIASEDSDSEVHIDSEELVNALEHATSKILDGENSRTSPEPLERIKSQVREDSDVIDATATDANLDEDVDLIEATAGTVVTMLAMGANPDRVINTVMSITGKSMNGDEKSVGGNSQLSLMDTINLLEADDDKKLDKGEISLLNAATATLAAKSVLSHGGSVSSAHAAASAILSTGEDGKLHSGKSGQEIANSVTAAAEAVESVMTGETREKTIWSVSSIMWNNKVSLVSIEEESGDEVEILWNNEDADHSSKEEMKLDSDTINHELAVEVIESAESVMRSGGTHEAAILKASSNILGENDSSTPNTTESDAEKHNLASGVAAVMLATGATEETTLNIVASILSDINEEVPDDISFESIENDMHIGKELDIRERTYPKKSTIAYSPSTMSRPQRTETDINRQMAAASVAAAASVLLAGGGISTAQAAAAEYLVNEAEKKSKRGNYRVRRKRKQVLTAAAATAAVTVSLDVENDHTRAITAVESVLKANGIFSGKKNDHVPGVTSVRCLKFKQEVNDGEQKKTFNAKNYFLRSISRANKKTTKKDDSVTTEEVTLTKKNESIHPEQPAEIPLKKSLLPKGTMDSSQRDDIDISVGSNNIFATSNDPKTPNYNTFGAIDAAVEDIVSGPQQYSLVQNSLSFIESGKDKFVHDMNQYRLVRKTIELAESHSKDLMASFSNLSDMMIGSQLSQFLEQSPSTSVPKDPSKNSQQNSQRERYKMAAKTATVMLSNGEEEEICVKAAFSIITNGNESLDDTSLVEEANIAGLNPSSPFHDLVEVAVASAQIVLNSGGDEASARNAASAILSDEVMKLYTGMFEKQNRKKAVSTVAAAAASAVGVIGSGLSDEEAVSVVLGVLLSNDVLLKKSIKIDKNPITEKTAVSETRQSSKKEESEPSEGLKEKEPSEKLERTAIDKVSDDDTFVPHQEPYPSFDTNSLLIKNSTLLTKDFPDEINMSNDEGVHANCNCSSYLFESQVMHPFKASLVAMSQIFEGTKEEISTDTHTSTESFDSVEEKGGIQLAVNKMITNEIDPIDETRENIENIPEVRASGVDERNQDERNQDEEFEETYSRISFVEKSVVASSVTSSTIRRKTKKFWKKLGKLGKKKESKQIGTVIEIYGE